jgi:hypothetical protein
VREQLEGKKARQVVGGLSRRIGGSQAQVAGRLAGWPACLAGTGRHGGGRPGIRSLTPLPTRRSWLRCGWPLAVPGRFARRSP